MVQESSRSQTLLHLEEQTPMFFAGLAEVHQAIEPDDRDGFVIIPAASDQGMVDIHDRKPLVPAPEHSREWVDPETSPSVQLRSPSSTAGQLRNFIGTK